MDAARPLARTGSTLVREVHDIRTAAALIGVVRDQTVHSLEIRLVDRSESGLAPAELEEIVQLDPRVIERPVGRAECSADPWLPTPGTREAGSFWAVLRPDCLWFPDHLETILAALRAGEPVVAWWLDVLAPIDRFRRQFLAWRDRLPPAVPRTWFQSRIQSSLLEAAVRGEAR